LGINLNKGVIIGIISGIAALIIFLILLHAGSDFDQRLIDQVDSGEPANRLIPQIEKETQKMQMKSRKRLLSYVLNKDYLSKNDSQTYAQFYKDDMKMISKYGSTRKKFAAREITKEQFINDIKEPKAYMEIWV